MKIQTGQEMVSTKARLVLAALLRNGWTVKRQLGSHRVLAKSGWPDYTFAYHDRVELGPVALKLLGKNGPTFRGSLTAYAAKETETSGIASPCSRRSAMTRNASACADVRACFRVRPETVTPGER